MKKLNNFIIEKLKINSSSKINKDDFKFPHITNNEVVNKIIYLFQIEQDEKRCIKNIKKWVNDNNVNNVIPIAYPSSLDEYETKLKFPKEITDFFRKQNSPDNCDECEALMDDTYTISSNDWGDFIIYGSKDIIAIHYTNMDNLYCLVDK